MTEKEHKSFLIQITNGVDTLIQDPLIKKRFKEQIEGTFKQDELYRQALDKCDKAAENNPDLRDRKKHPEGWKWVNYMKEHNPPYPYSKEKGIAVVRESKECWCPPDLPADLLGDYLPRLVDWPLVIPEDPLPPLSDEKKLMLEHFLLAVIHDFVLIESKDNIARLIYFDDCNRNEVALSIWNSIKKFHTYNTMDKPYHSDDIRAHIKRAIKHVKAVAETGQETAPAKYWGIGDWLWKLYEKAVKAFFDSLLGK